VAVHHGEALIIKGSNMNDGEAHPHSKPDAFIGLQVAAGSWCRARAILAAPWPLAPIFRASS